MSFIATGIFQDPSQQKKIRLGRKENKQERGGGQMTDSGGECAASLIRLVSLSESCSAVLRHVPQIINMHCGGYVTKGHSQGNFNS